MLDIMLDEKASSKYDCSTCTKAMQKVRNCDNQFDPVTLRINKRNYQVCPVSIYLRNLEIKQMIGMYMHARNRKMPFTKGAMVDQTNWYYEFSNLIESKIGKNHEDQMEDMKKDMKKNKQPIAKQRPTMRGSRGKK